MLKKNTQVVLIVLLLALIGLLIWQNLPEKAVEPAEDEYLSLLGVDSQDTDLQNALAVYQSLMPIATVLDIKSLHWTSAAGEIEIEQDAQDGFFYLLQPSLSKDMTDTTAVQDVLQSLTEIEIAFDPGDQLTKAQTGLVTPQIEVILLTMDGTEYHLQVGDLTPTQDGYYVSLNGGSPKVVAATPIEQLGSFLDELPLLPLPTPAAEQEN